MPVEFEISTVIRATATELYEAWLDSQGHTKMTGGQAKASAEVGAHFTAWDGYIEGQNLELVKHTRIVQSWRTIEFDNSDPDSRLEVLLEPVEEGTRMTIRHSNLPPHGTQYEQGWVDNYFEPMRRYFEEEGGP